VTILILGGTGEARALAAALVADGREVLSSLAGRVQRPRLPEGPVRIGGFGGATGLAEFLRAEKITAVVDATHPFAATITANAAIATSETGTPRLVLRRPAWAQDPSWLAAREHRSEERARSGSSWLSVPDIASAALAVQEWPGRSVFLTTGRRDLAAFANDERHDFLVRTVDPPEGSVPPQLTLILDRGPYTVDGELALFRKHRIGLLVTKNSGGSMTMAKLAAAQVANIPVIMVQRPPLPAGSDVVDTVEAALDWLALHRLRLNSDSGGA